MKKNPALAALVVVAVIAAIATVVVLALAAAGVGRSYDAFSMTTSGGIPLWTALIPAAVTVLAGIAALVLWGLGRGTTKPSGQEAEPSGQ